MGLRKFSRNMSYSWSWTIFFSFYLDNTKTINLRLKRIWYSAVCRASASSNNETIRHMQQQLSPRVLPTNQIDPANFTKEGTYSEKFDPRPGPQPFEVIGILRIDTNFNRLHKSSRLFWKYQLNFFIFQLPDVLSVNLYRKLLRY